MTANFRDAYDKLEIPDQLVKAAKREGGFQLYLSGGGFRGWGYLLLYQSQTGDHHYPISIINGFWAGGKAFGNTEKLKETARKTKDIFRVSDRRRKQVPAVAFLINTLSLALPYGIKEARFCQGSVREGILFQYLPASVRKEDPLEPITSPYARPSAKGIADILLRRSHLAQKMTHALSPVL
jgi:retrograde regulation protein 2